MNLINGLIMFLVMLLTGLLVVCTRMIMYKDKNFISLYKKLFHIIKLHIYYSIVCIGLCVMALFFICNNAELVDGLKLSTILIVLMFTSLIDLDRKIIPNYVVLSVLIFRTLLFSYEYYTYCLNNRETSEFASVVEETSDNILYSFINSFSFVIAMSVISGLICMLILLAASVISKGGMGMGDVKLISVIGYTIGISLSFETLMFSMIICLITSLGLLLTGKKKKKDSIAFGPFIYLGYAMAVIANLV